MHSSPTNCRLAYRPAQTLLLLVASFALCGCVSPELENQAENNPSAPAIPVESSVADSSVAENLLEKEATAKLADPVLTPIEEALQQPSPAEAYLSNFDERSKSFRHQALPATEIKKVADGLRTRYPLKSIRDRLSFQMKEPSADFTGGSSRRTAALRSLHSDKVAQFIQNEGAGLTRISPISPDDLKPYRYEYATKIISKPVGSPLLSEPLVQLDAEYKTRSSRRKIDDGKQVPDPDYFNQLSSEGLPKQQLVSEFNDRAIYFFTSQTLGFVKSLDEVAGFEHHQLKLPMAWNQNLRSARTEFEQTDDKNPAETRWKVNRLQLVSLLMQEEPAVYVTDELPNMQKLSSANAETRSLNAFETDGLDKLRSGKALHIQATRNRIIMMGAIRASGACCQCHAVEKDSLLGAFSYEFLRSPRMASPKSPHVE